MKKKKVKKKGAMELSFGMIFSVILIVIFLALAFYAINKVLSTQKFVKINTSVKSFQDDINEMYKNSGGNYEQAGEYTFPSSRDKFCFIDYECGATSGRGCIRGRGSATIYDEMEKRYDEGENLFFYPEKSSEGVYSVTIKNINLNEITKVTNPYCIDSIDGKLIVTLKRVEGSSLVIVSK